jgi:hypothetical protein
MTYGPNVAAQLFRLGREATVKPRVESGTNEFGNVTDDHNDSNSRTVIAFRTYPNRNTQITSNRGDRDQDRPVFLVPNTEDQPKPPDPEDMIVYDGTEYEVKSHTPYETHVEFFGAPIIHDESNL